MSQRTVSQLPPAARHLHLVPSLLVDDVELTVQPTVKPTDLTARALHPSAGGFIPDTTPEAPTAPAAKPDSKPASKPAATDAPRRSGGLRTRMFRNVGCRSDATELRSTLASLGPAWRLVRGLPDEGVHSLLIGPGGVFALTVQSFAHARVAVGGGRVTVDGRQTAIVQERRVVADAMGRRLSAAVGTDVRVQSLVAVIHSQPRWSFCEQPADGRVTVLPGRKVADFLSEQVPVLSARDVERYAAAAVAPARPQRPALRAI